MSLAFDFGPPRSWLKMRPSGCGMHWKPTHWETRQGDTHTTNSVSRSNACWASSIPCVLLDISHLPATWDSRATSVRGWERSLESQASTCEECPRGLFWRHRLLESSAGIPDSTWALTRWDRRAGPLPTGSRHGPQEREGSTSVSVTDTLATILGLGSHLQWYHLDPSLCPRIWMMNSNPFRNFSRVLMGKEGRPGSIPSHTLPGYLEEWMLTHRAAWGTPPTW